MQNLATITDPNADTCVAIHNTGDRWAIAIIRVKGRRTRYAHKVVRVNPEGTYMAMHVVVTEGEARTLANQEWMKARGHDVAPMILCK